MATTLLFVLFGSCCFIFCSHGSPVDISPVKDRGLVDISAGTTVKDRGLLDISDGTTVKDQSPGIPSVKDRGLLDISAGTTVKDQSPVKDRGPAAVKECELTTGRTLTIIKSVGFPAKYGSNVDCEYTVRRRSRSVCSVTFLFNVMDLEQSDNCSKDYLELKGEKMCGSKPIGFSRTVQFSEKDQVTMSFHSDNETRGLGYMVTVVQQDCPIPSCDATFQTPHFVLESPNHPLPYDNGRTCTYVVKKSDPGVCRLIVKVEAFDVEPDPECNSDYLMVNGDRMCGVMTEGQILDISFTNDTMLMEFVSDHVTTRDGFKLNVHQQHCDHSTTTPTSATSTPQPSTSTELSSNTITDVDTSTLPQSTTE